MKSKFEQLVSPFVATAGAAVLISALQGSFFALQGSSASLNLIGTMVAALNLLIAILFLRDRKRSWLWVVILNLVQLAVFGIHLGRLQSPVSFRILQVAIALAYGATLLMILLTAIRILPLSKAILLSFSTAFAILTGESILGAIGYSPVKEALPSPLWVGSMQPHPDLGWIYTPHSTLKTYYPDNPRNYFREVDPRESLWWLRTDNGNQARLVLPSNGANSVRVEIDKLVSAIPYDVQLNRSNLRVELGREYVLRLRARADKPRTIFLGFARAHSPWNGLGLYEEITLGSDWQFFEKHFRATADDHNGRIFLDIGNNETPIEVAEVGVYTIPDNKFIDSAIRRNKYVVSYEFNALGCRGSDYEIPKPNNVYRVLMLGDSYTLGVGVHEPDTFTNKMQQFLNKQNTNTRYEFINCGVSGYGTREERMFYKLFGQRYQPDVVVVVMVWNDDLSFADELRSGYVARQPSALEHLFYDWGKVQQYRYQRPSPNFNQAADELLILNDEVQQHGARLAAVIFRNDADFSGSTENGKLWNLLTETVMAKLRGTNIPLLDLGRKLYANHDEAQLLVHPTIDGHPNNVAQAIAAEEILTFLKQERLIVLPHRSESAVDSEQR